MALKFEKRGSTWVCWDPDWDFMLIARDLYFGTERLLSTLTVARIVEGAANMTVQTERIDMLIGTRCMNLAKECARRLASASIGSEDANKSAILAMIDALKEYLLNIRGEIDSFSLLDIAVPEDMTPRYTLWPVIPSSRPGMVVGPSGQGKSGFAAFAGLSVVTGLTLHPRLEPRAEGPVLYIGQEEDKEQWAARLHQICRGHDIALPKHYYYLKLASGSLLDSAERIAELASTKHAVLIIVDSAQATWGMEGDSVRGYASQWYNAVDQLGVPALVVEHPNAADTKKPASMSFAAGSSVKRDRVGHQWALKSVEMPVRSDEPLRYHVTLTDTKRNYVARQPDITYETVIHGYEWMRFVEADEMSAETIVSGSRNADLIAGMLRTVDQAHQEGFTTMEIAKNLGMKDDRRINIEMRNEVWRQARWDPDIQYSFVRTPGTGTSPVNPAKWLLATDRRGIQMSMLPGDPDEIQ